MGRPILNKVLGKCEVNGSSVLNTSHESFGCQKKSSFQGKFIYTKGFSSFFQRLKAGVFVSQTCFIRDKNVDL
jgi:hypothetical protein